jgi:PAS domain S-box-containing protein
LALDKAEEVTESWVGFCHVLGADEETIRLQTWSTHTETVICQAESHAQHYPVGQAGVWAEAIRQRQPVIHNDYESLDNKGGLPEGHAHLVRELVVPIFRQDTIVAVFGLGNKPTPYSEKDLELVSQIAEHTWDVVGQKQVQAELRKSESRYRGIVEDQVELICRYTPEGELTFVNQAYADFFGCSAEELIGFNLFNLMPEEERDWVRQKYLDLTPDDSETRYRHQVYAADGSLRWVEWTDRAIYDSQEKLVEYQSVGYDIHDQVLLEQALKKREEEYQELVGYLQQSREEERSLLASEIHDSLGQSLTVMRFDLDWALKQVSENDPEVRERLESTMETVNQTISQVRKIGVGLRPDLLDNLGLIAALDWLLDNFGERSDLAFRLEVSGREERLDPELEVDIFRLAQEAVTNVARHAEAEQVELRLHIGEHAVRLEVADDGKGISPPSAVGPESFGLVSMRERTRRWDGDFSVRKNEQGGTTLNAIFSKKGQADD